MKRAIALMVTSLIIAWGVTFTLPRESHGAEITWKLLSSWPKGYPEIDEFLLGWAKRINEATGGKLNPKWMGGPEVVHPFEQLKAVQTGVCDVLFTHPAYHPEVVSAGQATDLFYASPKKRAEVGWSKIMADVYKARANVKYLSPFASGIPYQIYLNKEIHKADWTGLKIRATPFYRPLVEGLGGVTVQLPTGEIYTGMQRGVIDGFCSPGVYPVQLKLFEVTKYAVLPGFGEASWILLVHERTWDKLGPDLKDVLEKTTLEYEEKMRPVFIDYWKKENQEIVKRGMKIIELPPPDAKKLLSVFEAKSWEELILKKDPEFGPKLKAVADKIEK